MNRGHPGRDRRASILAPISIRYGRDLGDIMLIFIIGFAYAAVSPVVVALVAIYFVMSWIVWRWQVVYVFVRCYEVRSPVSLRELHWVRMFIDSWQLWSWPNARPHGCTYDESGMLHMLTWFF